jgi:hypothetical protein
MSPFSHRALSRCALCLVAALACPLLALPDTASRPFDGGELSANLVPNPEIESGVDGAPSGWTFHSEGGEGLWAQEGAHGSRRSLRIDGLGFWTSAPVPLAAGKVTLIEMATRLEGSGRWGGLVMLDFLDASGRRVGKLDPYLRDTHGWTVIRWGGVAPPGTVTGVLVAYTFEDHGLKAWFDDAVIRQWSERPVALSASPLDPALRGFDFGPMGSDVQPGYVAIGPTSRYLPETGFGWSGASRLEGRDQGADEFCPQRSEPVEPAVAYTRSCLDALSRDYIWGVGAAHFRVDVPPGRYEIFLIAGHSLRKEAPPYFDLLVTSGRERLGRLSKRVPGVAFVWETFRVEVGESGLDLGLASDRFGGVWALSALVVAPEAAAEAGWREAARVVRSLEAAPEERLSGMQRIPWGIGEPVWPPTDGVSPERRVRAALTLLDATTAAGGKPVRGLDAAVSPGLSADWIVLLLTSRSVAWPAIDVAAFSGPAGAEIAADQARIGWARERALRYNEGFVDERLYTIEPDALESRAPTHLTSGTRTPIWVRVRVPEGTAPGRYRSRLRLAGAGSEIVIPLEIRVLPFGTVSPSLLQNVYFGGSAGVLVSSPTVGVEEEAGALRAAGVRDIVDHLGSATAYFDRFVVYERKDGEVAIEGAYMRERLDDFRRAGHPAHDALVALQPILTGLAEVRAPAEAAKFGKHLSAAPDLPEAYWRAFGDLIVRLDRELAAQGVERRLYNPWDEPFGDDLDLFLRAAGVVRERLGSARIFCNVPGSVYYGGEGTGPERALAPVCDAWWVYGTLTDAEREREIARGTWLLGSFVPDDATQARAAAGLLRWRRRESGGNWWAYDVFTGSANTQLDGPSWGDRCLVYPGSPPVPRIAWEATRMGHEDLRYLETLTAAVGRALVNPLPGVRQAGRRGSALLDRLRQETDPTLHEPFGWMSAYDQVRRDAIAAIERIVAAEGG